MPAGDALAEGIVGAEIRADMLDEKRASIAAEKRASIVATGGENRLHLPAAPTSEAGTDIENMYPTAEELATLRRVANKIPPKLFTIAFIELCERFSYYGSTAVCKYIQNSLTNIILNMLSFMLIDFFHSHKLHSAATPSRLYDRRLPRAGRRSRHGPANCNGHYDLESGI